MDVSAIHLISLTIEQQYPQNSTRKNYFLAACNYLDKNVMLDNINEDVPFGGIIGIDNSALDKIFKYIKIFRLHAVLHDAAGYMRNTHQLGPGYCYALPHFPFNSCYLGHITGLLYCINVKFLSSFYDELRC